MNHKKEYVSAQSQNTNQAGSFFSRFRSMQLGQVHEFGNLYLNLYANDAAYREDARRKSISEIFFNIIERAADKPVSRHFAGYRQGNKKQAETLL